MIIKRSELMADSRPQFAQDDTTYRCWKIMWDCYHSGPSGPTFLAWLCGMATVVVVVAFKRDPRGLFLLIILVPGWILAALGLPEKVGFCHLAGPAYYVYLIWSYHVICGGLFAYCLTHQLLPKNNKKLAVVMLIIVSGLVIAKSIINLFFSNNIGG